MTGEGGCRYRHAAVFRLVLNPEPDARPVLDLEQGKPDKQQPPEPAGHAALIPEIHDMQCPAGPEQSHRPLQRFLPGRDHGQRIGKHDVVEAVRLVEGRFRIELFRKGEAETDLRLEAGAAQGCFRRFQRRANFTRLRAVPQPISQIVWPGAGASSRISRSRPSR